MPDDNDLFHIMGKLGGLVANYYSSARSNYFKVGRPKEFMEWAKTIPNLQVDTPEKRSEPKDLVVMLYIDDVDGGGWPTYRFVTRVEGDDAYDEEVDIDFFQEVSEFLAPGEVAIFMEVGAEKLRYLVGHACAVNSDGDFIHVGLDDIYEKVKEKWDIDNVTLAEY